MQSLRLLVATAVLAVAVAQPDRLSAWDPTARDKTEECVKFTEFTTDANAKCPMFDLCCKQPDPLNGDKCKEVVKKCETNDDGELEFTCKYSNCTEMITTTTTTTTQSPRQINGASVYSAILSASALLPIFF
ncbi:hypothetical protein PRIPAC_71036 [Pristionchus pacificus]|uniref:Uncharacterized protein n=1 Tax=Pristionchus pacificus TaxID=54126 RepID=A0A2A6C137_PRIPA|nr:hypothetical protein PRIPAC_71036 [Pristionchus pacificus]|eukprot:PDM71826.1 hypothetical protein PRIPAC_38233 [Pristionchus pacificus]